MGEGPRVICFCGGEHIAGWCLRASNGYCTHGVGKAWAPAAADGFEICGYCGEGRPSSPRPVEER